MALMKTRSIPAFDWRNAVNDAADVSLWAGGRTKYCRSNEGRVDSKGMHTDSKCYECNPMK